MTRMNSILDLTYVFMKHIATLITIDSLLIDFYERYLHFKSQNDVLPFEWVATHLPSLELAMTPFPFPKLIGL